MNLKTFFIFTILSALAGTVQAQNFEGKWLVQKKDAVVEIFKKGNKYYGKLTKDTPALDKNGKPLRDLKNPDKSKRNRSIQGLVFLTNFEKDGDELVNGRIYDPKSGKTYKGKIWIENGKLQLRGYLGIFYETREWTRVK